ncbi:8-oxo-dGTP pyrophosphatase MutT (NUDIX family) [Curtobacterium luteum]|uniref:8-oxo-dGTP pyrophosphatase MutT (NUDIX family) n=1 Tax=Curtobacterium luteum TaxID=33881 RepID=A0A8H9G6N0_9MICO|nr:8-oxo-dGTP pyrophosphatase MutT (NUDIX family) [Curtobacterium luteum]GGK92453.1 coenzyme A pyrophosphatase [Curtobacterium luteum]
MSDEQARAALATVGRETTAPLVPTLPTLRSPRRAAVLMLFGVLDDHPSDRRASAPRVSDDLDVLLLRRADTLRAHPSQVAFPGGRIDAGDADAADTALREAHEETGLDRTGVDVLGVLPAVPLAHSNHLVEPVLAWWRAPSPVRAVDEGESATVFRAPVADLLDPAHRGVTVIRREGQEWRGPAFTLDTAHGTETVWGFTAMLLDALFDRLGWTEPWDDRAVIPLPAER